MTTPDVERNVETVMRLFRAVEKRDFEPMYEIYDTAVEVNEAHCLPYGGSYRGHEGIVEHGLRYVAAWDHLQTADDRRLGAEFVGLGDRVLVRWRQKAHAGGHSIDHPVVSDYLLGTGRSSRAGCTPLIAPRSLISSPTPRRHHAPRWTTACERVVDGHRIGAAGGLLSVVFGRRGPS